MGTNWTAAADPPDPAGLYGEGDVAAMAELLGVAPERRASLGRRLGVAAAAYLRLRHLETAPRPAAVRDRLEFLGGQLGATRRTLLTLEDATMQALVNAFHELPAGHPIARRDLVRQLADAQRQLRDLCVLTVRAVRDHTDRRGRPTKDAVREFVWRLAKVYEDFAGRRPGRRGKFPKLVELAARPVVPGSATAALHHVVREIARARNEPADGCPIFRPLSGPPFCCQERLRPQPLVEKTPGADIDDRQRLCGGPGHDLARRPHDLRTRPPARSRRSPRRLG
ncbi:MAG TPA: hypothetical protein VFY87_07315 [Geminicoccaceae bacterium]|nr:hypothetical protein [Geminicoccaceae bacterium]